MRFGFAWRGFSVIAACAGMLLAAVGCDDLPRGPRPRSAGDTARDGSAGDTARDGSAGDTARDGSAGDTARDATGCPSNDRGPFQFVSYEYKVQSLFHVAPPDPPSTYQVSSTGVASRSAGCSGSGQVPADALAKLIEAATSPDVVAPFLCDTPCPPIFGSDAVFTVTLTLANRTTYARTGMCIPQVQGLIDVANPLIVAACGP